MDTLYVNMISYLSENIQLELLFSAIAWIFATEQNN
jgi:hypothetical protein